MTVTTLQPDGTAGRDSLMISNFPDNNYQNSTLNVGESSTQVQVARSVLKFTGLSDGTIDAAAIVDSAILHLWVAADFSTNARTMRVYRQKRAWVEMYVTWNKYDSVNAWQSPGGFGANDCEQTEVGSHAFSDAEAVDSEHQISLTPSSVQDFISGAFANNGWLLKMDTESDDQWNFYSSDASSANAAKRPEIVVTWHLAGGLWTPRTTIL